MKQVYLDQIIDVNDTLALDSKQAHHIFDVLRTSSKEKFVLLLKAQVSFMDMYWISPNYILMKS